MIFSQSFLDLHTGSLLELPISQKNLQNQILASFTTKQVKITIIK